MNNRRIIPGSHIVGAIVAAFAMATLGLVLLAFAGDTERQPARSAPVGTAFTYQGRLEDGESPANGTYDFQFKLCDDETAQPCQVGGATVADYADDEHVGEGLFTVKLDLGADVFNGQVRWLEVGVRPGASSGADPYTTLTPRQPITPAPYALHTRGAIPVVNVRDYGANGDGVIGAPATDDTAAIQDALDAAPSGAMVVFPPPATFYRVSAPLVVERPMTLLGAGAELQLAIGGVSLIAVTSNDVAIRGLRLVGPQLGGPGGDCAHPGSIDDCSDTGERGIDARDRFGFPTQGGMGIANDLHAQQSGEKLTVTSQRDRGRAFPGKL